MCRPWVNVLAAICVIGLVGCNSGSFQSATSGDAITASSGTPQSHAVGGAFASPLVATVTKGGAPASGMIVTFSAPTAGASATFADTHTATTTAKTDANGLATSAALVANNTAGNYEVVASLTGSSTSATFSLSNTTAAPATLEVTGGGSQSVLHNSAFPAPLAITVLDSGNNPVSNAVVVFEAPATGPSGIFTDTGTVATSAITNLKGVATSVVFTANTIAGSYTVTATVGVAPALLAAAFNLTNLAGSPAAIVATTGISQFTAISTAFTAPLVATVFDSTLNPVAGAPVTFSAPTTSASGTFANGQTTETDTTDANGMATSTVFTANATTGGPYTVTAAAAGVTSPADFSLTNTLPLKTYVFYLSGEDISATFYALAGAVKIDSAGHVLAGEQDYNDGLFGGLASPEPSGDKITGGVLTVSTTTGQGTLTLNTDNASLGNGTGTETLGVQFVNVGHALIAEFDGAATSSGSMDVQTLPPALSGGYAFTMTGVDPVGSPVAFGGVFTITNGTSLQSGILDTNDNGTPTTNVALSGTLSPVDSFGRGTISSTINYDQIVGSPAPVALNYYVVGPEVLRIIDVDSPNNGAASSDTAIGSAFGQGINATSASNASLGVSVFGISEGIGGTPLADIFAAAGMLSTVAGGNFSGIGDEEEMFIIGSPVSSAITGTYSIQNNGYGSLTIAPGQLGDISALGIYMTDPNLNLSDPNNTATGLGGALMADMDVVLPGATGLLIRQTDTSTTSFKGTYAFAAQDQNQLGGEYDFVGRGSVNTSEVLAGHGLLSDPFFTFGANATNTGVSFSGTVQADSSNAGRYTMLTANSNPLAITVSPTTLDYDVVLYQASGGELMWVNVNADDTSVFLGSLEKMGSLTGLP